MNWNEVRESYPEQWVVVEALRAHSTPDSVRHIDEVVVIDRCSDGGRAMDRYRQLHREHPAREIYCIHTSRGGLDIEERVWIGARGV